MSIYVTPPLEWVPSPEVVQRAATFSSSLGTRQQVQYQQRGGFKLSDNQWGKVAEEAVAYWIRSVGKECSDPDYSDWSVSGYPQDRYPPDLTVGNIKVHVKARVEGTRWTASWVFQPADPVTTTPSTDDVFFFVTVVDRDEPRLRLTFVGTCDALLGMWRPPVPH